MREALFWLLLSRLLVRLIPFRRIARYLGTAGRESAAVISASDAAAAVQVRAIVRGVCRRLRWRPSCLVRSLAAMVLLRRTGVEGTLYLGAASNGERLRAHAWVRCGQVFVVGDRGRAGYTVLNSFTRGA